ncbi:MAG TPA: GldG family protein [Thermoanaerobaculia bacterium]|nr:GldG family protein [Thermoanaerobaculia bacterium]
MSARARERVTRRQVVFGTTLGAAVLLALVLVGIVNYLASRHYQRWDWTRSRLYTLSEKSRNILSDLDQEITAVVFMDDQSQLYQPVSELLARYAAASPHLQVQHIDPARNRAQAERLVERYDIQRANVVVFVGPDDKRVVDAADLAEYDYSALQMGGAPEMQGFRGEQKFTSAILELMEAEKPTLLFTTGHGEASLDSFDPGGLGRLQQFLGQDNFEIEEWASLGKDDVPADADLVVVAGPTSPFSAPELVALGRFLDRGGRLLLLVDPTLTPTTELVSVGLAPWLAEYGVTLRDDIVVDPANLLPFFSAETIFAANYGSHPITDALRQARVPVVFALARSVTGSGDAEITELVRTSDQGWGETDLENLASVSRGEGDTPGPVSLGVAVELPAAAGAGPRPPGEREGDDEDEGAGEAAPPAGRLVVYGDSDWVTNSQLDQPGNATLAADTLNWLVERESHLGIAPKEPEQVRLSLMPQQRRLMFWLVIAGLPSLALIAGGVVFYRRRR